MKTYSGRTRVGRHPKRGKAPVSLQQHRKLGSLLGHTLDEMTHTFVAVANNYPADCRFRRLLCAADKAIGALACEAEEVMFAECADLHWLSELERLSIYYGHLSRTRRRP